MRYKLTPELSSGDWNEFCSRFHFSSTDLPHVQAIYSALFPLVNSYAYYSLDQNIAIDAPLKYAYGFVTLGNGVDEMSELYLVHEQVKEAYIVDCLSLMLLSKAYEEFAYVVENQCGLFLSELSFLGDTYPIELISDIYNHLLPDDIYLTEGKMIHPLKTAALILLLDEKPHTDIKQLCNTCATCKNLSCPSRKTASEKLPHTYGAMQIFNVR